MKLLIKEEFDTLTTAQKRVKIAQDVIQRIKSKIIVPHNGNFFCNRDEINRAVDPKESFNTSSCQVCAKGALMVSWVGNFNNASWEDIDDTTEEIGYSRYPSDLLEIFGREMLDNIEAAFESNTFCWHYDEDITSDYAHQFRDYDLKGIMQYIVDHEGEFPLPKP